MRPLLFRTIMQFFIWETSHSNVVTNTSPTLLKIMSELVSKGQVSKKSLSLAQAVQSHITSTRNQTTLGLTAKLHHKYGSSELIKLLQAMVS